MGGGDALIRLSRSKVSLCGVLIMMVLASLTSGCRPAAPVVSPETVTTDEDTPVTIDVLANDTAASTGGILSVTNCTDGSHGTVTLSGDEVTYTPAAGFTGWDRFTYTVSDGHGGTAEGQVTVTVRPVDEYPSIVIDWDSFFAGLPDPGWDDAFEAHHAAAYLALKRAYAANPYVNLDLGPNGSDSPNAWEYDWELLAHSLESGLPDNPALARANVPFSGGVSEPGGTEIAGALDAHWSPGSSEVVLEQMNQALSDISRCVIEGYLPVSEAFWMGYDSLIRFETRELLPESGVYYLPGSDGREIEVRLRPDGYEQDRYFVNFGLKVSQLYRSGWPQTDWADVAVEVSEPQPGESFSDYRGRVLNALVTYWGPRDSHVSVNSGGTMSPSEDWWETELSWLRVPGSADEACVLEKLAMRFSPIDAVAAEDARADHGSLTVTEELAWEPRSYEGAPPTWQALAGARDVIIGAYLPVDDTFADQLAATELSEDSAADLVGQDGRKIHFEVEELTQEAGLWRCLYTLTWGQ